MAPVAGSKFRRALFWAHLGCGVLGGAIIVIASATGVLLAFERQLIDSAARANRLATVPATAPLPADRLAELGRAALPGARRPSLVFDADPAMPVAVTPGGEGTPVLLDPYSGAVMPDAAAGRRQFLRTMETWHRWLGGRPGGTGGQLVGLATLMFLFITCSGLYLWLPAALRLALLKARWTPRLQYPNSRARDYGWHIAFSFWMLVPLFVIALSGVVMSFDWANRLVYAAYGEQAPQRRAAPAGPGGPRGREAQGAGSQAPAGTEAPQQQASLESLLAAARQQAAGWQHLTVPASVRGATVDIVAELSSADRRAPRQAITLSTADASVLHVGPAQAGPTAQSPGQRARGWFRFAHTGEQYGLVGQAIAALASLAACLLAYTGIALAWRRLVVPLLRRA